MGRWKMLSGIGCFAMIWLGCLNPSAFGQAKPLTLNYSTHMPAQHGVTLNAIDWGKEIEKRTQGKVKFTVMPGSTMLGADKCYDGVVKGIADVGLAVPGFTRGRFPLSEVLDLPLGYRAPPLRPGWPTSTTGSSCPRSSRNPGSCTSSRTDPASSTRKRSSTPWPMSRG